MDTSTSWSSRHEPPRSRKTWVYTVWAIGLLSLLCWGSLYLDYGRRMPAEPEPATGRIYPYQFKNRIVYVSGSERRRIRLAGWVFVGSMAAFAITVLLVDRR